MLQRRLNEFIHWNIGLDESSASRAIDLEDISKGADIDDGFACLRRPCAICAAVVDAESNFCSVKVPDARAYRFDGGFVALHLLRGRGQDKRMFALAAANAVLCGYGVWLEKSH